MVSILTRFRIVALETTGVGALLLLTFILNQFGLGKLVPSLDSDFPIIGGALIFVGLEILSLTGRLPSVTAQGGPRADRQTGPSGRSRFIDLKEIMSYELRIWGSKAILPEFFLAAMVGVVLTGVYLFYPGISSPYRYQAIFWLGFASNCLTVLAVSTSLVKQGLKKESDLELSAAERAKLRKLGALIVLLLIAPFATLISQGFRFVRKKPSAPSEMGRFK